MQPYKIYELIRSERASLYAKIFAELEKIACKSGGAKDVKMREQSEENGNHRNLLLHAAIHGIRKMAFKFVENENQMNLKQSG
jgi:hypothetical protein